MKSKCADWSRNHPPYAEENTLDGSAPRPKRATDNRSSDRLHCECPGTHTTTTTGPRPAKAGNQKQRRQPTGDTSRRSTKKRHLDQRANHDAEPEKRPRHEEEPTETRAPRTHITTSRTRDGGATGHARTESRGQNNAERRSERSDKTSGPATTGRSRPKPSTKAGAGVPSPTSPGQDLLVKRSSPTARNLVDLSFRKAGPRVTAAETTRT